MRREMKLKCRRRFCCAVSSVFIIFVEEPFSVLSNFQGAPKQETNKKDRKYKMQIHFAELWASFNFFFLIARIIHAQLKIQKHKNNFVIGTASNYFHLSTWEELKLVYRTEH